MKRRGGRVPCMSVLFPTPASFAPWSRQGEWESMSVPGDLAGRALKGLETLEGACSGRNPPAGTFPLTQPQCPPPSFSSSA